MDGSNSNDDLGKNNYQFETDNFKDDDELFDPNINLEYANFINVVIDATLNNTVPFTSLNVLQNIDYYNSTVEIIGYVDMTFGVVQNEDHKILTFTLSNGNCALIHITVWDDDINRILHYIRLNRIIHLDGVYCNFIEKKYNKCTLPYQLIVQSNTVINCFGNHVISDNELRQYPTVLLKNVGSTRRYVRIQAVLKTWFGLVVKSNTNNYGCGSITDGEHKLEVRIFKFSNEDSSKFKKGQHIELIGSMQYSSNIVYLLIKSVSDVTHINVKQERLLFLLKAMDILDLDGIESMASFYTFTEDLKAIKLYDSTVEVIGYVDNVIATKLRKEHMVFTFTLNNNDDEIVQVTVWNDEIGRIEPFIQCHKIVHLDGVYSKPIDKKYNKGTTNFELIVQSNTVLNILGTHQIQSISNLEPQLVELKDAATIGGCIKIRPSLKTAFGLITKQNSSAVSYGCGSITDGKHKLEIRITRFAKEDCTKFCKGQHIEVFGNMQCSTNPMYFSVNCLADIKLVDNKQDSFMFVLGGTRSIPTKRAQEETEKEILKKSKLNA